MPVSLVIFESHLETIDKHAWEKLWKMIPVIEQTKQFGTWEGMSCIGSGIQMPYFVAGPLIEEFVDLVEDMQLLVDYDWTSWKLGRYAVEHLEFHEGDFDIVDLCKLITMILRSNRFKEGLTGACFEKGLMVQILKSLKAEVETRGWA